MIKWPKGKDFAFTIIDDTDQATVDDLKPVYDLLTELNLKTTKTVWVYPPRDHWIGQSLMDPEYLNFIKKLQSEGFEIALHNVGSGGFSREEIIDGFEIFNNRIGYYPRIQINHDSNPDNIYWGHERYVFPLSNLFRWFYGERRNYFGDNMQSQYFWGDYSKQYIKYIRNHCFNGINTLAYDPRMPYSVKAKIHYSNNWFSSSDGHTVEEFTNLISNKNIHKLIKKKGACIVYTHFAYGFLDSAGKVNSKFERQMRYLAKQNGWYVPVGELLAHIATRSKNNNADYLYLLRLDLLWLIERIKKTIRYGR